MQKIICSLIMILLIGCTEELKRPANVSPQNVDILLGSWSPTFLKHQEKVKVPNEKSMWGQPFIHFAKNEKINGNSGVNLFGGSYKVENGKLSFSGMFSTRRAGEFDEYERLFLNALNKTNSFVYTDETLSLLDNGQVLLKLKRIPMNKSDK